MPVKLDLQTVAVFFVLNFSAISLMIYALLWYFASEKQRLRAQVDQQHEELRIEKERSERLLLNVLPPGIAERLKRGESNIAQGHADVTVMFADIVGFTKMTEELSPVETVKILNDVFSMFDEIADKFGVEKIKTIGDAVHGGRGRRDGRAGALRRRGGRHGARNARARPRVPAAHRGEDRASHRHRHRSRWWRASSARRSSSTTCGATR